MPFIGIRISGLRRVEPAMFSITYRHRDYGSGRIVVSEAALQPLDRDVVVPSEYPKQLTKPTIAWEGISVKTGKTRTWPGRATRIRSTCCAGKRSARIMTVPGSRPCRRPAC